MENNPNDYDHIYKVVSEIAEDRFFFFFKRAENYLIELEYIRVSDPWEDFETGKSPIYVKRSALGVRYIAQIVKVPIMMGTGE